jgi:hypothetical protein
VADRSHWLPPKGKLTVGIVLTTREGSSAIVTCWVLGDDGGRGSGSFDQLRARSRFGKRDSERPDAGGIRGEHPTGTTAAATSVPSPGGLGGGSGILLPGIARERTADVPAEPVRWALSFAALALSHSAELLAIVWRRDQTERRPGETIC